MTAQPSLFDAPSNQPPRCKLCVRPAHWSARKAEYGLYCTSRACENRERLCQICGTTFIVGADGAGTKYCSAECKQQGYHPYAPVRAVCAWCNQPSSTPDRGRIWPYVCRPCKEPIKHVIGRLVDHRVDHERARRLLTDRGCEICGVDIVAKVQDRHGKHRALLVVDHDHACCPVDSTSCGRCIRGLICRSCNVALGMIRDDPTIARALAEYLTRSEYRD